MKEYNFNGLGAKYVAAVSRLMGKSFTKAYTEHGVVFTHESGKEFLKLVDDDAHLIVIFYVPVPSLHKENKIEKLSAKEWQFKGEKVQEVYALIELALSANKIEHDFELSTRKSTPS